MCVFLLSRILAKRTCRVCFNYSIWLPSLEVSMNYKHSEVKREEKESNFFQLSHAVILHHLIGYFLFLISKHLPQFSLGTAIFVLRVQWTLCSYSVTKPNSIAWRVKYSSRLLRYLLLNVAWLECVGMCSFNFYVSLDVIFFCISCYVQHMKVVQHKT